MLSGSMSTVDVIEGYVSAALYSGARSSMTDSSTTHVLNTEATEISALFSRTLIFSLCMVAFLVILI